MDDIHLSRELLHAADRGLIPRDALERIKTEHLLSRCPHCRAERVAFEKEKSAGTSAVSRLGRLFQMLAERLVRPWALGVRQAERDFRDLLALPPAERERRVDRARRRFRGPLLVQRLIAESRRLALGDPGQAFELAALARRVIVHTPWVPGYFDHYTLVIAHLANARRAMGDLQEAHQLFLLVRQVMAEHGVTDPAVVGRVDDLQGSLRKDQRRFAEAEKLLERAAMLFTLLRAPEEAARVLINLGDLFSTRGDAEPAIETTRSALVLLGPAADRKLQIAAHYNLALYLVQAGRPEEAFAALEESTPLFEQVQEPWLQLRLLWLRGDLAAWQGDLASAERAYRETRDGFIAQGIGYDAAMVSLDLAVLCLRQGRTSDVRQIAEEMLPIFEAQDIHREALAVLVLFRDAALLDQLTVERALEIATRLRQARGQDAAETGSHPKRSGSCL